jgi:hypothetical protein
VDAQVGKAVAAVGVVLALVAIWVNALTGQSYWDLDGTVGVFLLLMAILAGLAVAAGMSRAMLLTGGILLGFYGFLPAAYATDHWGVLDAGAWLGFCGGALIALGAVAILAPSWFHAGTRVEASPLAAGIAALGVVLSVVAIWPDADKGGSYWNAPALGHSLGVVMLIAAIATGLGLAAGSAMGSRPGLGLAAVAGSILCGLMLFLPVGDAFNQLGDLRAGGWLGFFGGLMAAGGTYALLGEEVSIGIAPVRQAPAPPPPSTA